MQDPNSLSNFQEVATTHLHLELTTDFEEKVLKGYVDIHATCVVSHPTYLVVDTFDIKIHNSLFVNDNGTTTPVQWSLDKKHEKFGSALRIQLPEGLAQGDKVVVRVEYESTKNATATQWLNPEQTVGKAHPYLFTQCQAIHARSMIPCQDSPAVKLTYSANITVPSSLVALMSALRCGEKHAQKDWKTYSFKQETSIPSYLIALAVGNLKGIEIGPRSTVWSEPEVVDQAADEFVDTERFIAIGEELLTPYEWGRYDLLVLPSSFPYGGMENPCLTFVTPTLLAGDRSLVDVVAHEIAHSWMGNLVTTCNWEHFWLNEGFTMFIERKIIGRMHGEASRQLSSITGVCALQESIEQFGKDNPLTCLCPRLENVDPDDSFSSVPYEKGYNFLYYLETLLGGSDIFEPYLRAHVKEFAHKSINTNDWKTFLYKYMKENHGEEKVALLNSVNWEAWLHTAGMPPVKNEFDDSLAVESKKLVSRWESINGGNNFKVSADEFHNLTTAQKILFMDSLLELKNTLKHSTLAMLDETYKLSDSRNCEIKFRWQSLCLNNNYECIFNFVETFLLQQGRMKYVRPLYRRFNKCNNGKGKAHELFKKNRQFYHPIAASLIAKDIGFKEE